MDDAGETAQAAAMSVLIVGIGLAVRLGYWALMRGVDSPHPGLARVPGSPDRRPMTRSVIDMFRRSRQFFEVLQETARPDRGHDHRPGRGRGPEETHAGDQVVYVIEGEGVLTIGGAEHGVRRGPAR